MYYIACTVSNLVISDKVHAFIIKKRALSQTRLYGIIWTQIKSNPVINFVVFINHFLKNDRPNVGDNIFIYNVHVQVRVSNRNIYEVHVLITYLDRTNGQLLVR